MPNNLSPNQKSIYKPKTALYRHENKKIEQDIANGKRVQKRTAGRKWVAMRKVVLANHPLCRVCKRKPSEQVDHIIPLSKGGTDEWGNLQGICLECHEKKTYEDLGLKIKQKIGLDGYPIDDQEA